jgi:hypothetical protein
VILLTGLGQRSVEGLGDVEFFRPEVLRLGRAGIFPKGKDRNGASYFEIAWIFLGDRVGPNREPRLIKEARSVH